MITKEVAEAIEELKSVYGADNVDTKEDGEGGAYVIVKGLSIGDKYIPSSIWCGFRITYMYPEAQVYPHFVNEELKRADGKDFGSGFSKKVSWNNLMTVQISRSSKNWRASIDTAQLKLEKVLQWIREQ